MITDLNPALILILGALLIPALKGSLRTLYVLLLPVLSFLQLYTLPASSRTEVEVLGMLLSLSLIHI